MVFDKINWHQPFGEGMRIKFLLKILVVSLIITQSCDAPRDNVLDPDNPDNTIHTITGNVETATVPFQPIAGVIITVKNTSYVTQSDSSGYFSIVLYDATSKILLFEKEGYHIDSATVIWGTRKQAQLEIHLNAQPKLDSVSFYSIVEYKYPDNTTTTLAAKAIVSDVEFDDIQNVAIENSYYNLHKNLSYNLAGGCYELTITSSDLLTPNINGVIGKNFNIIVENSSGHSFVIGRTNIKRIIDQQPEFISPANNIDTITVGPILRWKRFDTGFYFTYKVHVYTNEIWPVLVWEKKNIASTEIEIAVDVALPEGNYFWVFWCIDEFQNRVRSKPASFKVIQ